MSKKFNLNKAFETYLKYLLSAGMASIGLFLIILALPTGATGIALPIALLMVSAGIVLILTAFGINWKDLKKVL